MANDVLEIVFSRGQCTFQFLQTVTDPVRLMVDMPFGAAIEAVSWKGAPVATALGRVNAGDTLWWDGHKLTTKH